MAIPSQEKEGKGNVPRCHLPVVRSQIHAALEGVEMVYWMRMSSSGDRTGEPVPLEFRPDARSGHFGDPDSEAGEGCQAGRNPAPA
jgi:hypothetical protein